MLLSELGEFGLIDRIRARIGRTASAPPGDVLRGIGDDCAVVRVDEDTAQVITTDVLIEGVHFLADAISPRQLGHKALAVNLSDVAAMGADPQSALVALAVPDRYTVEYLSELYDGMLLLADRFGVEIVGGDTCASTHDLFVSIALTGVAPQSAIRYRDAAQPGDALLVAGVLGESGAGLESLREELPLPGQVEQRLRMRHHEPTPLVAEGRWLARSGMVHAMMDVSDGIASDVHHICRASGVGAVIEADALPISDALAQFLQATGRPAERYLLHAGEDYALLLTAPPDRADALVREFRDRFDTPIARIGRATGPADVILRRPDGQTEPLVGGHDHFRTR